MLENCYDSYRPPSLSLWPCVESSYNDSNVMKFLNLINIWKICEQVMDNLIRNMPKLRHSEKKRTSTKYRNITFLALLLDGFCLLTCVLISFLQGENTGPHVCLGITV
jgi:hypothetical protein